ncbi:MAG: hypothetical protein FWG08_05020 [Propionibacteriaceae bacterium]|nr:hypothetical protein [Propionibacteriaceae bacterium]
MSNIKKSLPQQDKTNRWQPGVTRAFRVEGLVPRDNPRQVSRWAVENIYNVVSEWQVGSLLVMLIVRAKGGGVRLYGWVDGLAPHDWFEDMVYACAPFAKIKRVAKVPRLPEPIFEVVPARTEPPTDMFGEIEELDTSSSETRIGQRAVPVRANDPMWEFLPLLETAMVIQISPASEIEQQMCDEQWRPIFKGRPQVEWEMYRSKPILTRVTLAEDSGRTRAESKMMSQRRDHARLTKEQAKNLRHPSVDCLMGHALPKEAACAMWSVPIAKKGELVPGMKVLPPELKRMPYDAPPKPAEAFRLGRCVNSYGNRKGVFIAPEDLGRHMRIVGATGSGKSTLVRSFLGPWIESGRGGVVVTVSQDLCVDIMGDVADPTRVLYWDLSDETKTVPYSLIRSTSEEEFVARVQALIAIFTERDSKEYTGPRFRRCVGLVARGCYRIFGDRCSEVAIFTILGSQALVGRLTRSLMGVDSALAGQIRSEIAELTGDSSSELWGWLACKAEEMLAPGPLIRSLSTGAKAIDFLDAMENNKVILINIDTSRGVLSAQLLGSMIVADLNLACRRRKNPNEMFPVVLDEAQLFQFGALPTLLDQGRKFGVGVMACHQRPLQLSEQVEDALSANASSYIQFKTGNEKDAGRASVILGGWPVDDFLRMPELMGVAVISRDGRPSQPFTLEVDFFKRHREQLADLELRQWRKDAVEQHSFDALVKDYRHLVPITAENVVSELESALTKKPTRRNNKSQAVRELDHTSIDSDLFDDPAIQRWLA